MKPRLTFLTCCVAIAFLATQSAAAQDSLSTHFSDSLVNKVGGAIRFNHNVSTWKPEQVKRGGDFGFEVFRINVDGKYKRWEWHVDQRFYAAAFGGAFLKYAWVQHNLSDRSNVKLGLIPAYFGSQQFNSHSWFFQLPFYLGFEDDHDMGISFSTQQDRLLLDIGFYKNAEELSFANNAPVSDSRYSYDLSGNLKELNTLHFRPQALLGKEKNHKLGFTAQFGMLWNIAEETSDGTRYAIAGHYNGDIGKRFNIQVQAMQYRIGNFDRVEMTAYGAGYNVAAEASLLSISAAYTIPIRNSFINSVQIYNDFTYMDKVFQSYDDTQMNVLGALIDAKPVYVFVDYASGINQPWLGPNYINALGFGNSADGWNARFNVNLGLYF